MKIPIQLQNIDFRFFLAKENTKRPMEYKWNDKNCYHFFDPRLMEHKGNYGVVTGYGNLVVLDFDELGFYNEIADQLPPTFTVLSAGKRLPHLYYILKGEMFRKVGIDKDNKRVLDVQADRCGIIGPNSKIEKILYDVHKDIPIANITIEHLNNIPGFSSRGKKEQYNGKEITLPAEIQKTMDGLKRLGVRRTLRRLHQCPFHAMSGKGNLSVLDTGRLYCFHEQKTWNNIEEFEKELIAYRNL